MCNSATVLPICISISYLITTLVAIVDRDYILAIWHNQRNMTWLEANEYCQNTYDSTLATVLTDNDLELTYNYSYFGGFIGLNDINKDNQWSWIDGSQCDVTNINNSAICTDFYEPNPSFTNSNDSVCSRIAFRGWRITDLPCNDWYTQFYCNKVRGYTHTNIEMNQSDAETYCQTVYGTHLATITENDLANLDVIPTAVQFINHWVGLISDNNSLIWLDGTEYNSDNNRVINNDTASCNSINYNDKTITGEYSCNQTLPFLCNKRSKPREYILHSGNETFKQAQTICQTLYGTDLATVITEEEFSDVLRMLPNFEVAWIGLRQIEGAFQWVDGTNCTENNSLCVPYWNQFENALQNECGFIHQVGAARSTSCDNKLGKFFCNKPLKPMPDFVPIINVSVEPVINVTERFIAGIGGFSLFPNGTYDGTDVVIPFEHTFMIQRPNINEEPISSVYWNAYQDSISENQTCIEMMEWYEEMMEWNVGSSTIVVGNIILCDMLNFVPKIGPTNFPDELTKYFPVKMNGNFDLDSIVFARDEVTGGYSTDMIQIWAHFYAIYTHENSKNKIGDLINSTVFPHSKTHSSGSISSESMIGEWIIYTAMYNDVDSMYKDVGDSSDWNITFNDYYFVEPGYTDLVIYMIGISASFPNGDTLDEYLRYIPTTVVNTTVVPSKDTPPPKDEHNSWMIVGIVFVVLFTISVMIIIYLLWDRNRVKTGGYQPTNAHDEVQMQNTTQVYNI